MIKVAICEDENLMLKGLAGLLEVYEDLSIIHLSENGKVLLETIKNTTVVPDVILMDIDMPLMGGFEATKLVKERYPKTKILMLSSHKGTFYVENAIKQGAHGYLNKGEDPEEIYNAINEVHVKGFFLNNMISFVRLQEFIQNGKITPNFTESSELSPREIQIVKLICEEKSAIEIAEHLNLGRTTVDSYRKNIMMKLGVKKIPGIVIYAIKNGLYIP